MEIGEGIICLIVAVGVQVSSDSAGVADEIQWLLGSRFVIA